MKTNWLEICTVSFTMVIKWSPDGECVRLLRNPPVYFRRDHGECFFSGLRRPMIAATDPLRVPQEMFTFSKWIANYGSLMSRLYKSVKFRFVCARSSNHFKFLPPSRSSNWSTCAKFESAGSPSSTLSKRILGQQKPLFLGECALVSTSSFRHLTQWALAYMAQGGP